MKHPKKWGGVSYAVLLPAARVSEDYSSSWRRLTGGTAILWGLALGRLFQQRTPWAWFSSRPLYDAAKVMARGLVPLAVAPAAETSTHHRRLALYTMQQAGSGQGAQG